MKNEGRGARGAKSEKPWRKNSRRVKPIRKTRAGSRRKTQEADQGSTAASAFLADRPKSSGRKSLLPRSGTPLRIRSVVRVKKCPHDGSRISAILPYFTTLEG